VNAFNRELLDDAETLQRADRGGLLRALASAGAQVRRATALRSEFGIDRLADAALPRALLVAPDSQVPYLSSLLGALGAQNAPVMDWRDAVLPKWAGPADALIVLSTDGRHPRLAELVSQADQRGLAIMVVAPADSPVGAAAARHPIADVSYLSEVPHRAVWWALATPALQAVEALGLAQTTDLLAQVADALDVVAETDRPDSSAFTGPAKLLAADLADSVPVIAGTGAGATVAARRIAGAVQLIGGSTAMAAALPDDVARIGALLEFAAVDNDIFADGSVEMVARPRLVLIGDDEPYGEHQDTKWDILGDEAGRRAASALAELASRSGIGCSRVAVPVAPPLVRFAAASATGDFAATYLALARGIDPCAPRLGELSH
jgi:glucose/mannose-6-phosphate isomerase